MYIKRLNKISYNISIVENCGNSTFALVDCRNLQQRKSKVDKACGLMTRQRKQRNFHIGADSLLL